MSDSGSFVDFMDEMRGWPLMAEQKRRSIEEMRLFEGACGLDVGCGTGEEVMAIANAVGPIGRAVGVDLSHEMLSVARARFGELDVPMQLIEGNIFDLPFANESFDATRAERVLEHLQDSSAGLAEMIRVTRSGGRVVAISPDIDNHAIDVGTRSITRAVLHHHCDRRANGWAGRQLYRLFREAGLEEIDLAAYTHVHTAAEEACDELDRRIELAFQDQVISEAERNQGLFEVDQARKRGYLLYATTHFMVAGTVP